MTDWGKIAVVIVFVISVLLSVILGIPSSNLALATPEIGTFLVSFLVGMMGAGVFLLILLITEKNLSVLQNDVIKDTFYMSFLYLLSGGFVAAVTQVSTGLVVSSSIHAIFLVGFGWQGAMAGVAGSGTIVKLNKDVTDATDMAEEKTEKAEVADITVENLEKIIEDLRKKLSKYE